MKDLHLSHLIRGMVPIFSQVFKTGRSMFSHLNATFVRSGHKTAQEVE